MAARTNHVAKEFVRAPRGVFVGGWKHAGPWLNRRLPRDTRRVFSEQMSTVTEIKKAVSKLPSRKKLAMIRWMRTQVNDRPGDRGAVVRAGTGTRKSDKRDTAEARRFLGDFDKAVQTIAAGPQPGGSIVTTLRKMRR